jgi:hypothetical protein
MFPVPHHYDGQFPVMASPGNSTIEANSIHASGTAQQEQRQVRLRTLDLFHSWFDKAIAQVYHVEMTMQS